MNMAFTMTIEPMYQHLKTCTSRNGWLRAYVGQEVMAIEKGQGIPRGGHVVKIGLIRFLLVRFEPLRRMIDEPEYGRWKVVAEGFPLMTPAEFVEMYCRANKCDPERIITHIEFEPLYPKRETARDFERAEVEQGRWPN